MRLAKIFGHNTFFLLRGEIEFPVFARLARFKNCLRMASLQKPAKGEQVRDTDFYSGWSKHSARSPSSNIEVRKASAKAVNSAPSQSLGILMGGP